MRLLVDIGNTRMKWAWLDGGELRDPGAAAHLGKVSSALLDPLQKDGHRPGEILIASVAASTVTDAVAQGLARGLAATVRVVETGAAACGVRNGYLDPRQLGVDRWLAMVAAFARYRAPLCVVDAGTAVTIDAVAGDGSHLGGFIVPGTALMHGALLRETGRIETAAAVRPIRRDDPGPWGRDTDACINRGSRRAITCLVESCVKALTGAERPGPVLVLTGGDAPALRDALSMNAEYRPMLVLEGLAASYGDSSG